MRPGLILAIVASLVVSGCSATAPVWRKRVEVALNDLDRMGAKTAYPQEFRGLLETFEHGDAVLYVQKDSQAADILYRLALQKSESLRLEYLRQKAIQAEEARRKAAEEQARAEEERLAREAAEAEQRLLEQERQQALEQERAAKESKQSPQIIQQLSTRYTVRRGETLPQIAGRSEIYNDVTLWPIIYRANRDQIRDPKRLWPGQVLIVPRHYSRDEEHEARQYSGKK